MAFPSAKVRSILFHALLFTLTFFTVTLAGVQWLNKNPFELSNFSDGLPYALTLLAMLSAHEFGHYFAARYHGIATTLPFYIPIPPFLGNPFGTLGAVIRIRSSVQSKLALFDIGIAGPLAGLVVSIGILLYGFTTLPGKEYLFSIHPEYRTTGQIPESGLAFGNSVLFWGFAKLFSHQGFVPPMNEIYHYPFLCVGWFGLFVTALNLIPVGQLDGGHILYAMLGHRVHGIIAKFFFALLIVMGTSGTLSLLVGWKFSIGTPGWLVWAAILFFFIKIKHPEIADVSELSAGRKFLGWIAFGIFVCSFPPIPFTD